MTDVESFGLLIRATKTLMKEVRISR